MIKTINITEFNQVWEMISEQPFDEKLNLNRNFYLYRGLPFTEYSLQTSVYRNCGELQAELEPALLKNFKKYAEAEDPTVIESIWHQMILGQHHKLPTRLLDWSHSPLVGLHFATTEQDLSRMNDHDCVVWRIDMKEMEELLPVRFKNRLKNQDSVVFSVDLLNQLAPTIAEYDEAMGDSAMAIIEPPSIDPRIINQFSFFSVVPLGMSDVGKFLEEKTHNTVKYVISKDLRWRIRDLLDQMNITERLIYPGLDGLSEWLARHYYVRK